MVGRKDSREVVVAIWLYTWCHRATLCHWIFISSSINGCQRAWVADPFAMRSWVSLNDFFIVLAGVPSWLRRMREEIGLPLRRYPQRAPAHHDFTKF